MSRRLLCWATFCEVIIFFSLRCSWSFFLMLLDIEYYLSTPIYSTFLTLVLRLCFVASNINMIIIVIIKKICCARFTPSFEIEHLEVIGGRNFFFSQFMSLKNRCYLFYRISVTHHVLNNTCFLNMIWMRQRDHAVDG